jgi:hypothetical protein
LPEKNLKVIADTESKGLEKDWKKYSYKEDLDRIENGLVLVYTDSTKDVELMSINFSAKKSKLLFLTVLGTSMEDSEYIGTQQKKILIEMVLL